MSRTLFTARAIPHKDQLYPTTGDWHYAGPAITVSVSDMNSYNNDYEFLIGIHEVIEAWLCRAAGIQEEDVSKFDQAYEVARESKSVTQHPYLSDLFGCHCTITDTSEPGDDIHAPYYKQHQLATSVERMLAAELQVSWNAYEQANLNLYAADTPGGIASKQQST